MEYVNQICSNNRKKGDIRDKIKKPREAEYLNKSGNTKISLKKFGRIIINYK